MEQTTNKHVATRSPWIPVALLFIFYAKFSCADSFPSKPIRLIVPYAAGGTTDIVGRVLAQPLASELRQPVIVENRAGAGGMVGAAAVAHASVDGYTLGVATVSTLATTPISSASPSYDPLLDFTPISLIAFVPNVMAINADIPARNMSAFVTLLKANPGRYSYASAGVGSIAHLDGELFRVLTQTNIVHVPYRGSGPALTDTVAGQVAAQFDNLSSALPFIKSGKLRALAIASPARAPELPDTPTYAEAGLPEMNNIAWFGLVGPRGLSIDAAQILGIATRKVLSDPEVMTVMLRNGARPKATTSQEFAKIIQAEYALRKKIIVEQHISVN